VSDSSANLPPRLGPPPLPDPAIPEPAAPARLKLALLALGILSLYVIVPGVLGALRSQGEEAVLPGTVRGVLMLCASELTVFAVVLAAALRLGRLQARDLWLQWRGLWTLPRALGWSVALRLLVGVSIASGLALWQGITGQPVVEAGELRPRVESMVNVAALQDPLYLALMLTLVSFVVAGLREELWRAGMIALLGRIWPGWFGGSRGPWLALFPVALLFGLGHTPQGPIGVAATTLLGLGLGAIMLRHRSLWDAVLAHGFFNAATFAALPLLARHLPGLLQEAGG